MVCSHVNGEGYTDSFSASYKKEATSVKSRVEHKGLSELLISLDSGSQ